MLKGPKCGVIGRTMVFALLAFIVEVDGHVACNAETLLKSVGWRIIRDLIFNFTVGNVFELWDLRKGSLEVLENLDIR